MLVFHPKPYQSSDFLMQSNNSEVLLFPKKAKLPAVSRTLRGQPALHWVCCVQSLQTVMQRGQCSSPRTPDGQPATCKAQKHLSSTSPTEVRDVDNKWSVTHFFLRWVIWHVCPASDTGTARSVKLCFSSVWIQRHPKLMNFSDA